MKKYITIIICALTIVAISSYAWLHRHQQPHNEQTHTHTPLTTELCATELINSNNTLSETSITEALANALAEKEDALWHAIKQETGVSKKECEALSRKDYVQFARENKAELKNICAGKKLSEGVVEKVKNIAQACGVMTELYVIPGKMRVSPAAADTNLLYVTEPIFAILSENEQKFVIAHELGHIINRDTAEQTALEALIQDSEKKDGLLAQLSRLREERADLFAITQGDAYRQGAIEFAEAFHNKYGTKTADTHPTYIQRLSAAQSIDALYQSVARA